MAPQVDQWLEYAPHLVTGGGLEPACAAVNAALAQRTFLVGYNLTIADIAVWAQLQSACSSRLSSASSRRALSAVFFLEGARLEPCL